LPPDYDWLFIGGSTEFKLGSTARECIKAAKSAGKKVHVGRVNTARRLNYCKMVGADTVDGTCIAFGKDINMAKLNRWMPRTLAQRTMYEQPVLQ
jgi:EAL domain-containing protein (putative c-di-GMP-specific phosphodiesterase class I)